MTDQEKLAFEAWLKTANITKSDRALALRIWEAARSFRQQFAPSLTQSADGHVRATGHNHFVILYDFKYGNDDITPMLMCNLCGEEMGE